MAPLVLIGGLLMVRKLQRFDLVLAYIVFALLAIAESTMLRGGNGLTALSRALFDSPVLFFAFVMITEPLTTPPTRRLRMSYGALVGFLFAPAMHLGAIYSTPELALLVGNLYSYWVSPKNKYVLTLRKKAYIATDTYDFLFTADKPLAFRPGQYLEWTLGHKHSDSRGNRRYFTVASSPTESEVRLGVKFYPEASSFKRELLTVERGGEIVAGQLAGDFTLPDKADKKLVFIAGGIGVTPFRSMVKYLIDKNEMRDIVLFYSNKTAEDIAYRSVFDEAQAKLGMRALYTLTGAAPAGWSGFTGPVTGEMIKREVPDYQERTFYVSGPHGMVKAFEKTLKELGVKHGQIKIDFFPGFA